VDVNHICKQTTAIDLNTIRFSFFTYEIIKNVVVFLIVEGHTGSLRDFMNDGSLVSEPFGIGSRTYVDRVANKNCSRTDECYPTHQGWQASLLGILKCYLSLILPVFTRPFVHTTYCSYVCPISRTGRGYQTCLLMRGLVNDVE